MRKRIMLCLIGIIFLAFYVISFGHEKKQETFMNDGIIYAVTVDGNSATAFPAKGDYFVNTSCTGATGVWDYVNWKLNVEKITGNVSCYVSFSSENMTYFNDYLINLAGTTQGNGQMVREVHDRKIDNSVFTVTNTLSESDYTVSSQGEFEWNSSSNTWYSNIGYYRFDIIEVKVKTGGQYQICYEPDFSDYRVYGIIYKDGVMIKKVYDYVSKCMYLGNLTTDNTIKVGFYGDKEGMSGFGFSLQKGSYSENITIQSTDISYRYEGKDPNNYVLFNNELWRIVGVFDEGSHGQSGKSLVKIVKDVPLGYIYSLSNAKSLLNGPYYNKQNGNGSSDCKLLYNVSGNCDYSFNGIDSSYRSMIKKVMWYQGQITKDNYTAYETYADERGIGGIPSTTTANIGLLYASDYGFSTLASACSRITYIDEYSGNLSCISNSWLTKNPVGLFMNDGVSDSSYYRPALYLGENVYYGGGDGSLLNPYIIGM